MKTLGYNGQAPRLFLSDNRQHVVNEIIRLVALMNAGDRGFRMSNGVCRLVLGAIGVGKTSLLQSMAVAIATAYPKVVPIYADFALINLPPSELIRRSLIARGINKNFSGIDGACNALDDHGLTAALFLDETEELYKRRDTSSFLRELHEIAAMANRRNVLGILSGSSATLPHLLFRHVSAVDQESFPSFNNAPSLNEGKVSPNRLLPFINRSEFIQLLSDIEPSIDWKLSDQGAQINRAFFRSGGVPRALWSSAPIAGPETPAEEAAFKVLLAANEQFRLRYLGAEADEAAIHNKIGSEDAFNVLPLPKSRILDAMNGVVQSTNSASLQFISMLDQGKLILSSQGQQELVVPGSPSLLLQFAMSSLKRPLASISRVANLINSFSISARVGPDGISGSLTFKK